MGLDVGEIGMGLDLGLDLRLFAARSATRMASAAAAKGGPDAVDACIRSLEEERRKIEVFRRELPLCVRLLADVIQELKEEAAKTGGDAVDDGDKRKWMSTAQLWVDNEGARSEDSDDKEQQSEVASPEPRLLGGAPMPSRAVASVPPPPPPSYFRTTTDKVAVTVGLPGLPVPAGDEHRHQNEAARIAATMPPTGPAHSSLHVQQQQQPQARKARRCWSPELHRKFVAALHQLGGPQVATPKQIREVMQVDGLTNDEVKSHLQKYRLHNRRSPGASTPVTHHIQFSGSGSGVGASAPSVGGDGSRSSSDEGDD